VQPPGEKPLKAVQQGETKLSRTMVENHKSLQYRENTETTRASSSLTVLCYTDGLKASLATCQTRVESLQQLPVADTNAFATEKRREYITHAGIVSSSESSLVERLKRK